MPILLITSIVVLIGAFTFASTSALADDATGNKGQSKKPETRKEKQRTVEGTAGGKAKAGGEVLGNRGPATPDKSWDEMTPTEKDAARKRWLLNSGDFGPPGGGPVNPAPKAGEKAPAPKQNLPAN